MDLYLDHGAYGTGSNRIGLDNPTWGVPQEGDGYTTSASTAASVAEIKINAVPTASETITVAGAVMTAAASAGANAFVRGAAPSNTATNIVALINSANFTNTVGTSVANNTGIGPLANQGRNLLYAQVKGGSPDTVQIMFRIGSDALNYANNSNVAITSASWGTPPTITQFTGGSSGCFGWLINPSALGQASTITVNQYGVLMSRPTVVRGATSANSVYALDVNDKVWLRSGAGQTIATTFATSVNRLASSNNLNLVLDSNSKWTGDSGTGVVSLDITPTAANSTWGLSNASTIHLEAMVAEKFKIRHVSAVAGSLLLSMPTLGIFRFTNLVFEDDVASAAAQTIFPLAMLQNGMSHSSGRVENCVFSYPKASASGRTICSGVGDGTGTRDWVFINCELRQNYTGSTNIATGVFTLGSAPAYCKLAWYGGKITGIGSYKQPLFSGGSAGSGELLIAENVLGMNIPATGLAYWTAESAGFYEDRFRGFYSTASAGRSWRWETMAGCADWLSDASPAFPLLNGRMLDNTQYSVRALWLYGTGQGWTRGFEVPEMRQGSRGATGTKTLLLEMLIPTAITPDAENMRFYIAYSDNSGNPITETKSGANLVASAASWTNAGSYPNHSAKKLTFTTVNQVAQYSAVVITPVLYGSSPTGANAEVYFDPGFTLS